MNSFFSLQTQKKSIQAFQETNKVSEAQFFWLDPITSIASIWSISWLSNFVALALLGGMLREYVVYPSVQRELGGVQLWSNEGAMTQPFNQYEDGNNLLAINGILLGYRSFFILIGIQIIVRIFLLHLANQLVSPIALAAYSEQRESNVSLCLCCSKSYFLGLIFDFDSSWSRTCQVQVGVFKAMVVLSYILVMHRLGYQRHNVDLKQLCRKNFQ